VQLEFSCNQCATELIIFIKNLKNYKCSFDPTLYTYTILRSNSLYLSYNKKEKFLTYLRD
jgi:hypothetical protein